MQCVTMVNGHVYCTHENQQPVAHLIIRDK